MRSVYIEASALFRAYKEEHGSNVMDYLFGLMESKIVTGLTSQFHFSVEIVKEKMKTIDIREKAAFNSLKRLVEG